MSETKFKKKEVISKPEDAEFIEDGNMKICMNILVTLKTTEMLNIMYLMSHLFGASWTVCLGRMARS